MWGSMWETGESVMRYWFKVMVAASYLQPTGMKQNRVALITWVFARVADFLVCRGGNPHPVRTRRDQDARNETSMQIEAIWEHFL